MGAFQKFGVSFNICTIAEAGNFKFGMQLELAKAHHKNHNQCIKWAWPSVREAFKYLGFPLIFLQRPHCPLSVSGASCYTSTSNMAAVHHLNFLNMQFFTFVRFVPIICILEQNFVSDYCWPEIRLNRSVY